MRVVAALLCLSQLFGLMAAQREHKVHNIVLYPHKHSWCKTTQILQVVAYPGCDSVEVENNVCVGGCFSYSIPRTFPSSPGEVVPYCDSCQPSFHSWKHVVLNCTSGDYEGKMLKKSVQIIENCTCAKCSDQTADLLQEDMPSDDEDEEDQPVRPQLLDITDTTHHKFGNYTILSNATDSNDTLINQRTLVLLGELSEGESEDVEGDQVALKEILHQVEGDNHKINGLILKDFVRKAEEQGHININTERLNKLLEKVEKLESESKNNHRHQHMVVGPHHSLVFPKDSLQTPEMFLKPTLDVPSHLLKPAHHGSELSYHNHLQPADDSDELETD